MVRTEFTPESAKATRDATCDGLRRIYLIILGLAIVEALTRTFSDQNGFLGAKLAEREHVTRILLLVAFLPTAIRFAHGGVLHLSEPFTAVTKWQRDMVGLLLQAILFFITSLALGDVFLFLFLFLGTIVLDSLWLLAIRRTGNRFEMERQWLMSNAALLILTAAVLAAFWRGYVSDIVVAASVAILSLGATIVDYSQNGDKYFPPAQEP